MHNYNIGNRYNTVTRVGNWYEEKQFDNHQFKEYIYQKQNHNNLTLNTTEKISFSHQDVALTKADPSATLLVADHVQLKNNHTQTVLAYNVNEVILGEETYAVTSSTEHKPVLRNVFSLQIVGDSASGRIKFGDKIRITSSSNGKKLYLQSLPASPMRSSKFSQEQQVSVTAALNSNSLWIVQKVNPQERFDSNGKEVNINEPVLLKHVLTAQWLATDFVKYVNDFGVQYQVFAKSYLTTNKTQNLFAQKQGHKTINNPLKQQGSQNEWLIIKG